SGTEVAIHIHSRPLRPRAAAKCRLTNRSRRTHATIHRHRQPPHSMSSIASAWAHDTGADLAKTNVNGGAVAIGHPLGASGARIMTTLVNALEQRGGRYGLQTMCEARGMANATIVERLARDPSRGSTMTNKRRGGRSWGCS